ncbi:hypothetical protein ACFQX4_17895 [Roseomonas sp. GCM10028921]
MQGVGETGLNDGTIRSFEWRFEIPGLDISGLRPPEWAADAPLFGMGASARQRMMRRLWNAYERGVIRRLLALQTSPGERYRDDMLLDDPCPW